jgi:surface carbohydrate biosynthesis protein
MISKFLASLSNWKNRVAIKRLLKKKITISEINQYDLMILDDGYANLNFKNICSFKIIKNEIFLQSLLRAFLKKIFSLKKISNKSLSYLYLKDLLKTAKPKVIIGHDFKENIFRIKKEFPEIFTIIYQFSDHDILNNKVISKAIGPNLRSDEFNCDLYLSKHEVFNSIVNFINAKFLIIGSVKNNEMVIKKNDKYVYDIMMISQYRPDVDAFSFNGIYNPKMLPIMDSALIFVTNILSNFCENKKLKLCIARTSSRKEKQDHIKKSDEEKFFSKILDQKNFYTEDTDSYQLAYKSKLVVTTYSTLGMELLSRGKKVLFIDPFYFLGGHIVNMLTDQQEGPYWYCGSDAKKIESKIDHLLKISNEEWREILKKSKLKMKYDPGNETLKEIIKTKIKN